MSVIIELLIMHRVAKSLMALRFRNSKTNQVEIKTVPDSKFLSLLSL